VTYVQSSVRFFDVRTKYDLRILLLANNDVVSFLILVFILYKIDHGEAEEEKNNSLW
jgi:hypothetical protein